MLSRLSGESLPQLESEDYLSRLEAALQPVCPSVVARLRDLHST